MNSAHNCTIEKGSILVYRVFDVAEEVDLSKVEQLLKDESGRERLKLARWPRHLVIMRNAPVTFSMGESEFDLDGQMVRAETFAKIWEYGVLSVHFSIPIEQGIGFEELTRLASLLEQEQSIDTVAKWRCQDIVSALRPALKDPHEWPEFEDYVIFFLEKINGIAKAEELIEKADIARLLIAETSDKLAKKNRDSILHSTYQYSEDDMAIIDWNSALVIEPSGRKEVPEVIEFALTHMMEMRYYDFLLDQKLTTIYDAVEESRSKLLSGRFTKLAKEASALFIEFTEFLERIDNSFKVVGDFYLANIFRVSGEEFRITEWQNNITRKMNLLARVSEMLQGEVNVSRSLWLEITVVVLIAFEILTALLKFGAH